MVADDSTASVTVFDTDTDTVVGAVSGISGSAVGDVAITADQTLGFVTNFNNQVYVIDLTAPPLSLPQALTLSPFPILAKTYRSALSVRQCSVAVAVADQGTQQTR